MNGMPAPRAGEGAVVLGLVLVVELVGQPLLDLLRHGLHIHAGSHPLGHAHDQAQVLQVGAHRLGHPGVLDLHGHVATVVEPGAIHLADRGGGHGVVVELGEELVQGPVEVAFHNVAHLLEGHPRGGVAQLGQLGLDVLLKLGREGAGVDEGGHLPDLHGRALHLAQHFEDLVRGLHLAPLRGLSAPILGAAQVRGLGGVGPCRLAPRQPAYLGRAPHPAGGEVLGHLDDCTRQRRGRVFLRCSW